MAYKKFDFSVFDASTAEQPSCECESVADVASVARVPFQTGIPDPSRACEYDIVKTKLFIYTDQGVTVPAGALHENSHRTPHGATLATSATVCSDKHLERAS